MKSLSYKSSGVRESIRPLVGSARMNNCTLDTTNVLPQPSLGVAVRAILQCRRIKVELVTVHGTPSNTCNACIVVGLVWIPNDVIHDSRIKNQDFSSQYKNDFAEAKKKWSEACAFFDLPGCSILKLTKLSLDRSSLVVTSSPFLM